MNGDSSNKKFRFTIMLVLFLLFTLLYFTGTRFNLDGYEMEYVLSARNIYHGGGPALASGFRSIPGIPDTDTEKVIYPRQNFLQSYLSVPFYALGVIFFGEDPTIPGRGFVWDFPWGPLFMIAWLNPILAAATILLVLKIAQATGCSYSHSVFLAIVYGLCSIAWPYAGLGMEVFQTFFVTFSIYSCIRYRKSLSMFWLLTSAVLLMLLPNCKKYSIIFVVPLLIYIIYYSLKSGKRLHRYLAAVILFLSMAGIFAMVFSIYVKSRMTPDYFDHLLEIMNPGNYSLMDAIFSQLISPGEGIFVFNPFLLLCLPGWKLFYRANKPEFYLFAGIIVTLTIVLFFIPHSLLDEEWGPRYLHVIIPLLVVAGATSLKLPPKGLYRSVFISILVVSSLIQFLGVLFLGFNILDAGLANQLQDYTSMIFIPSRSQIYIGTQLSYSLIHRYITGSSSELHTIIHRNYSGLGGVTEVLSTSLKGYDQPVGVFFTVRWVLAEMGKPAGEEHDMLILEIMTILFLIAGIITVHSHAN